MYRLNITIGDYDAIVNTLPFMILGYHDTYNKQLVSKMMSKMQLEKPDESATLIKDIPDDMAREDITNAEELMEQARQRAELVAQVRIDAERIRREIEKTNKEYNKRQKQRASQDSTKSSQQRQRSSTSSTTSGTSRVQKADKMRQEQDNRQKKPRKARYSLSQEQILTPSAVEDADDSNDDTYEPTQPMPKRQRGARGSGINKKLQKQAKKAAQTSSQQSISRSAEFLQLNFGKKQ
jgi:phage shock protein A